MEPLKIYIFTKSEIFLKKIKDNLSGNGVDVVGLEDLRIDQVEQDSYAVIDNCLEEKFENQSVLSFVKQFERKVILIDNLKTTQDRKYSNDVFFADLLKANSNLGILLIDEVVDSEYINQSGVLFKLIKDSVYSERIRIPLQLTSFNLVSLDGLIGLIAKEVLSFGLSGQIVRVVGQDVDLQQILNILGILTEDTLPENSQLSSVDINYSLSTQVPFKLSNEIKNIKRKIKDESKNLITNTVKSVRSTIDPPINSLSVNQVNNKKIKFRLGNYSFRNKALLLIKVAIFSFFAYFIPLLISFVSCLILLITFYLYPFSPKLALNLADGSYFISSKAKEINFGNTLFYDFAVVVNRMSSVAKESFLLVDSMVTLSGSVFSNTPYDLDGLTSDISASLDKLYVDLSFLETEIERVKFAEKIIFMGTFNIGTDFKQFKEYVYQLKIISSRLSYLLGGDKQMKYVVLFQNNMELRATGGFIGSFAILTFDNGRMVDLSVSDVYSADGQLKGFVAPPEPISLYLNEPSWFLRDSNWDPNFKSSAQKAMWFLDKEIDVSLDGIIAIDLFFVKQVMLVIGNLVLTDFNKTITVDNLYFETQTEVENNFFPGSIKKASFLSALASEFSLKVKESLEKKGLAILNSVRSSFESRHIQAYFIDSQTQLALKNLSYTGEHDYSTDCGDLCLRSSYLLVDSNLGVNKANLYITRDHVLTSKINATELRNELLVTYNNSANPGMGDKARYKNYLRIFLPLDANVNGIRYYPDESGYQDIAYDEKVHENYKELGFLVDIPAGKKHQVQFSWSLGNKKLLNGGVLKFHTYKQAGTEADKFYFNFGPEGYLLTGLGRSVYNTNLDRDFVQTLYLKKK